MEIKHKHDGRNGSFYIASEGSNLASMEYLIMGNSVMNILHTEVDPSLQGQNIGIKLINNAVDYALENKLKIQPSCSFVQSVFLKHPEKFKEVANNY